jgi:hypothetical protein
VSWTRLTILPAILILTTSCSTFGVKPIQVSSKPVEINIIQPAMPRGIDLEDIKWNVVSTAPIANPCVKNSDSDPDKPGAREKEDHPDGLLKEDGTPVRVCKNGKENPEWPEGYSYLDQFLDNNRKLNNGDVVFMAISIGDYEIMSGNMQELRRYIREVQEVVVYYRNVTIKTPKGDQAAVGVQAKVKQ